MWVYNSVPYMCEPMDIIQKIRKECLLNGRDILREAKLTTNAIMFTCPWHKNGAEQKPSCGLIIQQKSKDSIPVGTVHCFTCSTIASLEEFISNCFGIFDGGVYGSKWLSSRFLQIDLGSREKLNLSAALSRGRLNNTNDIESSSYITEEELDTYRYIHPYMYQRKLTDDIIDKFDIGYDKSFILDEKNPRCYPIECITFPVRDINGNCLFVARRAIYSKLFHYPDSVSKPLYGLYELNKYAPADLNEVYICESILDSTTIWGYGKYAIALNGTGSATQLRDLQKLKYRRIILALDADEAGVKGCKKIYNALKDTKILIRIKIPNGKKDMNDLTKEEFDNLPQFFMNDNVNF